MRLLQKDVLITGATGAIGEALAKRLSRSGYGLHLTARKPSRLKPLLKQLANRPGRVRLYTLELRDIAGCQDVVRQFFLRAENPSALICNAGNLGSVEPFRHSDFKAWSQGLAENFLAQAAMIHSFARHFGKNNSRQGTILTFSGAGLGANTSFERISSYSTAKAALTHLVEALAPELREIDLTINAMAPGQVASGITRQAIKAGKKAGLFALSAKECLRTGGISPELVCDLAEFLLSPAARHISGRLLSARFDQAALKTDPETIARDPSRFRMRRIDGHLFEARRA